MLERFYVYGIRRSGETEHRTRNLYEFFDDEDNVKAVAELFNEIFEASEYDKYVAERYQMFLISMMRYGKPTARESILQVMFRSIVHRCYSTEVAESASTILASVLPFHSNGSFEEYVVLLLAYTNAENEAEAALERNPSLRDASRLNEVRELLGIALRAVARKEGGLISFEAFGLSPHPESDLCRESTRDGGRPATITSLGCVLVEEEHRSGVNYPDLDDIDASDARGTVSFERSASETRALVTSIKHWTENNCGNSEEFQSLSDQVDHLARHFAEVETLLRTVPSGVAAEFSALAEKALSRVRDVLKVSISSMEQNSLACTGSDRGLIVKWRSKALRVFRHRHLSATMLAVETNIKAASIALLLLTSALNNVIVMHEHRTALLPRRDIPSLAEIQHEAYRPIIFVPAPIETVSLNFDGKDAEGRPTTPEAALKQSVVFSVSSSIVAAGGALSNSYAAVGMAGVGKSVALRGLAYDKDIRSCFPDGVLLMTLGLGATTETVIGELVKIVAATGANILVETLQFSTSLPDAVDFAVTWFQGKTCLFLVDDVWPTKNRRTGFLTDLLQLLRESPASRMAISTRSLAIARCTGAVVRFGARDPAGSVSEQIFMAHAARGLSPETLANQDPELRDSVQKTLLMCGGLPIALAITGSAVAFLSRALGDFDIACDEFATRLEEKRSTIGDEDWVDGSALTAAILLCLELLQVKTDHSLKDLYTSLCVVENQARFPVSVLGRLWQLDEHAVIDIVRLFCEMSLAVLLQDSEPSGIVLHDLLLEFCRRRAAESNEISLWHAQLLNGYISASNQPGAEQSMEYVAHSVLSFEPRPWWSFVVPEDGYIHASLSRHLACAGRSMELAALLLDGRWTKLRGRVGGILALKTDFELLEKCFERMESLGPELLAAEVKHSFEHIWKAVQLSWGRMVTGPRVFQFHLCGRLESLRMSSILVNSYFKSIEKFTPKPCLVPMNSFFPELHSALMMELPVGGPCHCVASSPCGRYIAAGAGGDILVADSNTYDVLKRMRGHTMDVTSVAFVAGCEEIVSGSEDGKVMTWKWQSSESAVQVFEGHRDAVQSIAVSRDGGRIFSCSDDATLRIWDTFTGTPTEELLQGSAATCVAVCEESQMIALGLANGTLRVLDCWTKNLLFEAPEMLTSSVSFSPNGSYLAVGSWDETVSVWHTGTWTRIGDRFKGHEGVATCVVFRADGKKRCIEFA